MRRALPILLYIVSLTVCLATGAMWARSAWWQDYFHIHRASQGSSARSVTLEFAGGWVAANYFSVPNLDPHTRLVWRTRPGHNVRPASAGAFRF